MSAFHHFFGKPSSAQAGAGRATKMSEIVSGCLFDIDATIGASYDGSGQVLNDLEGNTNWQLGSTSGVSTDDPTFNGSANSPAAYFSTDGFDTITPSAVTAKLAEMHKGDNDWTYAVAGRTPASGTQSLLRTGANPGLALGWDAAATRVRSLQLGDTGITSGNFAATLAANTEFLVFLSYNSATNQTTGWINSVTGTSVAHTFNASAVNATSASTFGATGSTSGARWKASALYPRVLSTDDVALLVAHYNLRHGVTYA